MGASGLSRCPIKSAVWRQTAHAAEPSSVEVGQAAAMGWQRLFKSHDRRLSKNPQVPDGDGRLLT